ncbi:MAG: hypothetical protein EON60_10970 [Alphaproteobacteria bacterium]|nr:MAG: hypothetical protein EON60_10970 [Alphaproteobacteria bacterium]
MKALRRKFMAMAFGRYLVIESLHYGLHRRSRRIGRFFSLENAKIVAREESARMQSRVVVMAVDEWAKVCVYKPRASRNAQFA